MTPFERCAPRLSRRPSCRPARPGRQSPPVVRLSFRVCSRRCLPPSRDGSTSLGLRCRSAHPFRRSPRTPRGSIPRVRGRVQGFSPASRSAPPSASRVCFTPQTPFGFPSRGFPSQGATPTLRWRRAVLPFLRRLRTHRLGTMGPSAHQLPSLGMEQVPLCDFTALLPLRVRAFEACG